MGKSRRGTVVGLFLVMLGLALLLICSIPVTSIEEAIDTSFTVASGTVYGPPNTGTSYHTRVHFKGVLGKSVLRGEVFTEGEGIHLIVRGYNAEHLTDTYVEGGHSFVVDPADDLYTFAFRNEGRSESIVRFTLEEIWTRPMAIGSPPFFMAGLVAFSLFATGLVILIVIYLRRRANPAPIPGLTSTVPETTVVGGVVFGMGLCILFGEVEIIRRLLDFP